MNNHVKKMTLSTDQYKKFWLWYLLLGLVLMILGVIGAIYSVDVTVMAMFWIGIFILIAGISELIYSFQNHHWSGLITHLILSLIAIALGIYIIVNPLGASMIFTLIIGCALIVIGTLRVIFSLQIRHLSIWWLIFIIGLISLILGILILTHWPVSGLWIIGFFISIEVFLAGCSMLLMSIAAKLYCTPTQ